MKQGNAISLISRIHENANKLMLRELSQNGIEGIVPSHGEIMAHLFANEELTMKDIAERIHRSKPTVTVLIDKLVAYGYVQKAKSALDNRVTFIRLTPKGRDLQPVFQKVSSKLTARIYAGMSAADAVALEAVLIKIGHNLDNF